VRAEGFEFFDANAALGSMQRGTWRPATDRAAMLAAMDLAGIERALVWHLGQLDWSVPEGNELTSAAVAGEGRLWGCWTLLPPQTGELPPVAQLLERMKRERIRAVRLFPGEHRYVAGRTALGPLLDTLRRRRVPVFLSLERGGVDYPLVDRLLAEFPGLPCVLCDVGVWGVDRFTRPLLERHPGLVLETSCLTLQDGVLDALVRDYGAGRLAFGTGFPDRHPASAMLPLVRADISDEDRQTIASGTLERVLGRVRL
jgi:predicted TIM-barrel fold metal-dependent hydrolase